MVSFVEGALAVILLVAARIFYYRYDFRKRARGCSLPPGPKGTPLLGNIRDLGNANQPWLGYSNLADQYGAQNHPHFPELSYDRVNSAVR